jgi:hypothetical protein
MVNWDYETVKQAAKLPLASFKTAQARPKCLNDIEWAARLLRLSCAQTRRLCRQGQLAGAYRAQRNGRWRIKRAVFLDWYETKSAK